MGKSRSKLRFELRRTSDRVFENLVGAVFGELKYGTVNTKKLGRLDRIFDKMQGGGPVAGLVGIEVGVVSVVINLESPALKRRPGDLIPTMQKSRLRPLMEKFGQLLREQPLFADIYGLI
jgi:hypothetical protein